MLSLYLHFVFALQTLQATLITMVQNTNNEHNIMNQNFLVSGQ